MSDYYYPTYRTEPATKEMLETLKRSVEMPELAAGLGYSWDEFRAWYDPEARIFYWGEAGGCSCNDFWDDFNSLGDFENGRKEDLLRAAKKYQAENSGSWSEITPEMVTRFETAVRAIKVAA